MGKRERLKNFLHLNRSNSSAQAQESYKQHYQKSHPGYDFNDSDSDHADLDVPVPGTKLSKRVPSDSVGGAVRALQHGNLTSTQADLELQRGLELQDAGQLEQGAEIFRRLASPSAANHPVAQVMYGLALQHGWGVRKDEAAGFQQLQLASTRRDNTKGYALSNFELGNSYRYGWGVAVDAEKCRQHYLVAAQEGDPDAMTEAAWAFLHGFGGKKDKFRAAQLLRRAEQQGIKEVGNSWIWKDKYNER